MEIADIQKLAGSEVVFATLFILFLVWYLRKTNEEKADQRAADSAREQYMNELHASREKTLQSMLEQQRDDSIAREAMLGEQMSKMADQQERIGDTLKEVSGGLVELEKKVDNNVMEIWKTMAAKGQKGE